VRGWYRHLATPCIGAVEYGLEQGINRDAVGRITQRLVAGRLYEYAYDAARPRAARRLHGPHRRTLSPQTTARHTRRNASYAYDHASPEARRAACEGAWAPFQASPRIRMRPGSTIQSLPSGVSDPSADTTCSTRRATAGFDWSSVRNTMIPQQVFGG